MLPGLGEVRHQPLLLVTAALVARAGANASWSKLKHWHPGRGGTNAMPAPCFLPPTLFMNCNCNSQPHVAKHSQLSHLPVSSLHWLANPLHLNPSPHAAALAPSGLYRARYTTPGIVAWSWGQRTHAWQQNWAAAKQKQRGRGGRQATGNGGAAAAPRPKTGGKCGVSSVRRSTHTATIKHFLKGGVWGLGVRSGRRRSGARTRRPFVRPLRTGQPRSSP